MQVANRTQVSPWLVAGLGLIVIATAVFVAADTDIWAKAIIWLQAMQRELHDRLALAVRAVDEHGFVAAWGLVGLSFLYGVFHAAGPGHGKVVITTYLLTQESQLRRGVTLSFLAALTQGVVAIVAVEATVTLFDMPLRGAQATASDFETASYAAVLLLGAVLVFTSLRRLVSRGRHHHHHHHGESGSCGHAHGPSPQDIGSGASWRKGLGVVLSVGLRPCSGAILVLLLAYALKLTLSGIAAVLAMSMGTALTVSALAALAVYARGFSIRLAEHMPEGHNRLGVVIDGVALAGGLVVLALGASLLHMALTAQPHPLMMP